MPASRILVGYDRSPHAEDAVAFARVLAEAIGAEIVLGQVVPWEPFLMTAVPLSELRAGFEQSEREVIEQLQVEAGRYGATAQAAPGASVAQGLYDLAAQLDPELVVVGSSHRGRAGQVLAGNVALRLLNGLDRPVAVAPAGYAAQPGQLNRIGVGFDGSPESKTALASAVDLARATGAELVLIGASVPIAELTPTPWAFAWGAGVSPNDLEERLREVVESAANDLPADVSHSVDVRTGSAEATLLDAAGSLDLLVVGSRGYGPVRRLLLGSVSGRLMREAPCPVMALPRPGSPDHEPVAELAGGATPP